ncbi:hypothetical protein OBV_24340 [Oscillibacter valericigenes Sjm18-20]|nr:hypothetical protein OBV_24340 [Oscillibacter valericigenes Sjm18-20]
MKLAFELVPDLATLIAPRHRFHLSILKDGAEIPNTRGSDSYSYHAMVLPNQPMVATGRDATHTFEPDLKGIRGIAGVAVDVPLADIGELDHIAVRLDNNLILSQEILQSFYSLRCYFGEKSLLLPLKSHLCHVDWNGLGTFDIEAGALCREFMKTPEAEEEKQDSTVLSLVQDSSYTQ